MPRSTRRALLDEQEHHQIETPSSVSADPTRRRREPHLSEAAKERWNGEVVSFARWLQGADWDGARETLEDSVARLFVGAGGYEAMEQGKQTLVESKQSLADASRTVAHETKEAGAWLWTRAEDAKVQAVASEKEAAQKTSDAAHSVAGHVKDGSWSLFGKATDVVTAAIDTVTKAAETVMDKAGPESPVEKALRKRYEQPSGLDKTVAQALEERSRPLPQR